MLMEISHGREGGENKRASAHVVVVVTQAHGLRDALWGMLEECGWGLGLLERREAPRVDTGGGKKRRRSTSTTTGLEKPPLRESATSSYFWTAAGGGGMERKETCVRGGVVGVKREASLYEREKGCGTCTVRTVHKKSTNNRKKLAIVRGIRTAEGGKNAKSRACWCVKAGGLKIQPHSLSSTKCLILRPREASI